MEQTKSATSSTSRPSRGRRFFLWIGLGGALVIILIVAAVIEWPNLFGDGLSPDQVVQHYCQALAQHDYNSAVGYLHMPFLDIPDASQRNGLRAVPVSASSLQQLAQHLASSNFGEVKGCSETKVFSSTPENAIVTTTATVYNQESGDSPYNLMIHLIKVGKNWRIDDPQLLY